MDSAAENDTFLQKMCKIVFDYVNKWIRIEQLNLMRIHDLQPWF